MLSPAGHAEGEDVEAGLAGFEGGAGDGADLRDLPFSDGEVAE